MKNTFDYLSGINTLEAKGYTDSQIAEHYGISIKELREAKEQSRKEHRDDQIMKCKELYNSGTSMADIAKKLDIPESTVITFIKKEI